jgi:hypothetical protein
MRLEYEEHLHVLHANGEDAYDEPARRHHQQYTALRLALLTALRLALLTALRLALLTRKRATVVRLRDRPGNRVRLISRR